MKPKSKTLNGILCKHDVPVEGYECNSGILFLHNERDNLGYLIKDFSRHEKVAISYFVSDVQKDEDEIVMAFMKYLYGGVEVDIESSGSPYSEVTPDICWDHSNELKIGGHDLNKELSPHVGKWILIRMSIAE